MGSNSCRLFGRSILTSRLFSLLARVARLSPARLLLPASLTISRESGTSHYAVHTNRISNAVEAVRSAANAGQRRPRLERILETGPGCVVRLDADGQSVFVNVRAEAGLGLGTGEMARQAYGDPGWELQEVNGEPIPNEEPPFRQVRGAGEPSYDATHTVTWPDGT